MSVIAVCSASGSPGATVLSLLLAQVTDRSPVVLIEASSTGGTLPGLGRLKWEPGLASLAAATRRDLDAETFLAHCQDLPAPPSAPANAEPAAKRVRVLVGVASPIEAAPSLTRLAGPLADLTLLMDGLVIVDAGSVSPGRPGWPLVTGADLTLLVVAQRERPAGETASRVQHARGLAVALAQGGANVAAVVIGEHPYTAAEISGALGVRVAAVIPHDRAELDQLVAGDTKRRSRSGLLAAVTGLASRLDDLADIVTPVSVAACTAATAPADVGPPTAERRSLAAAVVAGIGVGRDGRR